MTHWISQLSRKDSPTFSTQLVGQGYIPWAPQAGRHVMDDYGYLREALPCNHYYPDATSYTLWYHFSNDTQYFYH